MIRYVVGDATAPVGDGPKIIAHICNTFGGWGRGFVLALSARWREPECQYREWYRNKDDFNLGHVRLVRVEEDMLVANMIAQVGYEEPVPVQYGALSGCLHRLAICAEELGASIHMPRIGTGLGGGTWDRIEPIIQKEIGHLDVTVYDLPGAK